MDGGLVGGLLWIFCEGMDNISPSGGREGGGTYLLVDCMIW